MIQDIKDEVLSSDPLYTIRDNSGNVLNDNVDISLKTPITQEGTPINRALFRNLQGDLYTQDRYNIPEISIVNPNNSSYIFNLYLPLTSYEVNKIVNIKGGRYPLSGENTYTTDIIPKTWTKDHNKKYHSSDGVILTSSTYVSDTYSPINAFDGSTSTHYSSTSVTGTYGYDWLKLEFPNPTKITKMKTYVRGDIVSTLRSCEVQGSNDGNTWDTLYTISSQQTSLTEITLNTTGYYKFYRLYCTIYHSSQEIQLDIYEWQVSEWKEAYEYIEEFTNPYLNINNLGAYKINGTINYGEKYTLVYNGTSWDIIGGKVVTGSFSNSDTIKTINLGFTPDLVIAYTSSNNLSSIASDSTLQIRGAGVPRIFTKEYKSTDSGCIIENGFTYLGGTSSVYYIAIKF